MSEEALNKAPSPYRLNELVLSRYARFAVQVADVSLHRIARYEQLSRDLGTGAALEQQRQNLLLAPRQIERPRRMRAP